MDLRTTHGLITALRSKRWQQEVDITWGVLGNGAGTVLTTRTNYYYVLPQGLQRVAQAINLGNVPPIPELMVELAEKDGAYAILGRAMQLPYWGDGDPYLPLHGSTHEAGEGEGRDPVNVYLRAIVPFRADEHSPANDSLVVAAGIYYNEETLGYQYFSGGNSPAFNLASSGSISGSGFYRWDLLYLDIPSNTLQILQGTEGPEGLVEHPDPPWSGSTASIPIAYVYQSYGSATVAEADLLDARQIVTGIGIPQNAGWLRGYEICSDSPPSDGEHLQYSSSQGCWVPVEVVSSRVQVTLLNKSGSQLVIGDVVITGSAVNESVMGTIQAGYHGKVLVAAETIASDSSGLFWERGGPFNVVVTGAVSRNDGLRTSNTLFRAKSAGASYSGSVFAVALTPAVGPASGSVNSLFL